MVGDSKRADLVPISENMQLLPPAVIENAMKSELKSYLNVFECAISIFSRRQENLLVSFKKLMYLKRNARKWEGENVDFRRIAPIRGRGFQRIQH